MCFIGERSLGYDKKELMKRNNGSIPECFGQRYGFDASDKKNLVKTKYLRYPL